MADPLKRERDLDAVPAMDALERLVADRDVRLYRAGGQYVASCGNAHWSVMVTAPGLGMAARGLGVAVRAMRREYRARLARIEGRRKR